MRAEKLLHNYRHKNRFCDFYSEVRDNCSQHTFTPLVLEYLQCHRLRE